MLKDKIKEYFQPHEQLIALDIGSGNIKMLEFEVEGDKPRLVNIAIAALKEGIFTNNLVSKPEIVTEAVNNLLSTNAIANKRAIISVPGPAALMKKVRIAQMKIEDLRQQVMLEAGSFLPNGLADVRVDFHISRQNESGTYDVLIVAVKNDIVDSFINPLSSAGVETAVVDIDYFALYNAFEMNYPEYVSELTAIIDIGARFSNIILAQHGEILYAGDLSFGSKVLNDLIQKEVGSDVSQAESWKLDITSAPADKQEKLKEVLAQRRTQLAIELNRQLNLFWSASGSPDTIKRIMLTGGGALFADFAEALQEKSGTTCEYIDPFKNIELAPEIDPEYVKGLSPIFAISVGLGLRQPADRIIPGKIKADKKAEDKKAEESA